MNVNEISKSGIECIYEKDRKSQEYYINTICHDVRNMNPNIIWKADGIFIPNNDYLRYYFGEESTNPEYNFYDIYGECIWVNKLMFPIINVVDEIVGFVGFDPFRYLEVHETNNALLNYYTYSTKNVMRKGDYLFCLAGTYKKALRDGYLIVTDGVFDSLSIAGEGFNSAALLGSTVTDAIAAQLRFIDRVIVPVDNDEAGIKLFEKLSVIHPNVIFVKQGKLKDADDILKTQFREKYVDGLMRAVKSSLPLSVMVSFSG